jgi:hypothetical protein
MQMYRVAGRVIAGLSGLLSLAFVLLSCGNAGMPTFVGNWQGTTSQGQPLSFVVKGDNTVFCFEFKVTDSQFRSLGSGCDSSALSYLINVDSFFVNSAPTFTAQGQFHGRTMAMGSIKDTADINPIDLMWTASKQ